VPRKLDCALGLILLPGSLPAVLRGKALGYLLLLAALAAISVSPRITFTGWRSRGLLEPAARLARLRQALRTVKSRPLNLIAAG